MCLRRAETMTMADGGRCGGQVPQCSLLKATCSSVCIVLFGIPGVVVVVVIISPSLTA